MVDALGGGRYLIAGSRDSGFGVRVAYAVVDTTRTWVFIDGRTYVIEAVERDGGERAAATDDQLALSAPMPATVASIAVTPGQDVSQGDLLVMLEAMKMELPIRAPHAGRIKSVACRTGELVQPGVPLLELE